MLAKGVFCGKGVCGWASVTCETEGDFWAFSCESLDSVLSCLGNISAMQKREVSVCYQWNRGGFLYIAYEIDGCFLAIPVLCCHPWSPPPCHDWQVPLA